MSVSKAVNSSETKLTIYAKFRGVFNTHLLIYLLWLKRKVKENKQDFWVCNLKLKKYIKKIPKLPFNFTISNMSYRKLKLTSYQKRKKTIFWQTNWNRKSIYKCHLNKIIPFKKSIDKMCSLLNYFNLIKRK